MKKFTISISLIFLLSGFAFAQNPRMHGGDSTKMDGCQMMGMGMGMMLPRVVANLPDGSILVQSGQKIIKYDKDLNLVKQVTVPADTASMQQLRRMCPNPPPPSKPGTPPSKP